MLNRSVFFFSSRRRHTRFDCDWSSDVCSSGLMMIEFLGWKPQAEVIRSAVRAALQENYVTPDLGGNKNTVAVGDWLVNFVGKKHLAKKLKESREENGRASWRGRGENSGVAGSFKKKKKKK